jgi:hypothetical protein
MPQDDRDLRALWQASPGVDPGVSVERLKKKEASLARRVKVRNAAEYAAGAIVIVAAARAIPGAPTLGMRLGFLVMIVAAVFVTWKLRRDGSPPPAPPPDATLAETIAHHRASLVRQRDLLRGVPRWYLAPLGAAILFFYGAVTLSVAHDLEPLVLARRLATPLGLTAAFFVFVGWLNRRAARKLQDRIDALDEESS